MDMNPEDSPALIAGKNVDYWFLRKSRIDHTE